MRGDAASGPRRALLVLVVVAAFAPPGAACAYTAQRLRGTASLLPAGSSLDHSTMESVSASAGDITAAGGAVSAESSLSARAAAVLPAGKRRSARRGVPKPEMGQSEGPLLMGHHELLKFQAIGDWGRQGGFNESGVAWAMAVHAAQNGIDFVISVGDNFYPHGLLSAEDANFAESFSRVFHHRELQVPWHAVLGNHDYGDGIQPGELPPVCPPGAPAWQCSAGPLTQLSARVAERDGRWRARRAGTLRLAGGALDVFMFDTTPFVQYYYDREWIHNPGGVAQQSWQANLAELEAELARSRAGWKIVVGHHPVRSNGASHGDTPELRKWVEPLLKRYGVQLYLAGHDHDLEHLRASDGAGRRELLHHVVTGAGSQTRGLAGAADSLFQHDQSGFVAVEVGRDQLEVRFLGLSHSRPLHTAVVHRSLCGEAAAGVAASARRSGGRAGRSSRDLGWKLQLRKG